MTFGNSVLAGLVAVTAGCSVVYPWAALIIGAVAGVVYNIGSEVRCSLQARALRRFSQMRAALMSGVCAPASAVLRRAGTHATWPQL